MEIFQFIDFFNLVFLQLKRVLFFFLEYCKTHFPCLYCLKKMEKWSFLDQNHWLTNFKIISVFRLVEVFIFIGQKVVFSFQNIVKHIFLAHIAKKKKLEKCQFFASQNFLFLQPRKGFFVLKYHKRHFPDLYCLAKKVGKMAIFGAKPWVNHFGKMSIFRLFELLVFIAQKGVFSFQNIAKHIFVAHIA